MRNVSKLFVGGFVLCTLLATSSCHRFRFDPDAYQQIMEIESIVDSVDQHHNWQLGGTHQYTVTAPKGIGAVKMYVLSENPLRTDEPVIMAQADISDGDVKKIGTYLTNDIARLYVAFRNREGTYTVTSFFTNNLKPEFYNFLARNVELTNINKLQAMTYLFEEECPVPGDYDYNDVVLRISQEPVGNRQIDLHVTLSAVGGTKQMAGGIRLMGYNYNSVESITTDNGDSFNKGGTKSDKPIETYQVWPDENLLQQSRDNEPLIAIFEDAHWALSDDEDVTSIVSGEKRKYYNTVKASSNTEKEESDSESKTPTVETSKTLPERTVTYHILFKEGTDISDFSLGKLDPFIVESYMDSRWEIHGYRQRHAQVLFEYTMTDVRALPWALIIPDGDFRYPVEGRHIGFGKHDVNGKDAGLFGPYAEPGHSFGQWAFNMNQSTDWYLHLFNENEAY